MQTLRVALAQINTTVGDFAGNASLVLEYGRRGAEAGADLVAFPELTLTGYPPEDLLIRAPFIDDAQRALDRLAAEANGLPPLLVGCIEFDRQLYNSAAMIHDGRVLGTYRKHFLPNYGVFDEYRYFQPGEQASLFLIGGIEVGVTICEDIWFPGGPLRMEALAGARLVVNINASPFHAGKPHVRDRMVATRAADNTVSIAWVNQVGGQDELVFDGNSAVFGPDGEVLAHAASMEEDFLVVDVPVGQVVQRQLHDVRLRRDRREGEQLQPIVVTTSPAARTAPAPSRSVSRPNDVEEVYRALVVGTRDYVLKSSFTDVLIALSGGIDSALVAVIAVDALGPDHVRGISLPSRYSSEGSIADAQALANRLGIELVSMPIEAMHQAALDTLAREFGSSEPGTAEENVQSRIRGLLTMALSNKSGAMVLTTGNKSEYACGYATLYGDMVGGFAVLKDVPKTLVYRLAQYRNAVSEVIPRSSIEKPPSAELRPGQLDVDSLPPYPILDPIIEAYVEDDKPLDEIVAMGFEEAAVRRVIGMINRNEYKRRQAPPGVKITPRAFGRDRRLPLASRYQGF